MDLTLRNYFKEQGLIDVVITGGPGSENEDLYYKIREYPNGMSQPGILLVKPDLTVVYSWASQPKKVSEQLVYYNIILVDSSARRLNIVLS